MMPADSPGMTLVLRAVRFACDLHAGQSKKRQRRSIIDHCLEVAALVSQAGLPADVVAAAVLHDSMEKTETGPHELEAGFGPIVRALVEAVTDGPGESDESIHARLTSAPAEAQTIKCADIVSNLEALARAGELTAKDLEDKAATLAVLGRADASLAARAAQVVERGAEQ